MRWLFQDIRYGLRIFAKRRVVTALMLVLLVLGTVLSAAVFSVVNTALLTRLPGNYDRLVVVTESHPLRGSNAACRPANFFDWKAENQAFEAATSQRNIKMDLSGMGDPERLDVTIVLEDFFAVLGVPPLRGRVFEDPDYDTVVGDATGWDAVSGVAVLSYPFWQSRFGGDPAALGKTLTLNGNVFTVVGIMPRSFQGLGGPPALWVPWVMPPEDRHDRHTHQLFGIAALEQEKSLEQAQTELAGIYQRLRDQFPEENRDWSVEIRPWRDVVLGDTKLALLVLLSGAALVLVIACANVAGLLLSIGTSRRREFAVRRALGASRWRIVGQLTTESLLLTGIGATLSVITAFTLWPLLSSMDVPTVNGLTLVPRIDTTVLVFVVVVSCTTGVIFGSVPALGASGPRLRPSFSGSDTRPGSLLVVSETALATVLLVAGGLVLRSFVELQRIDHGFDRRGLLAMTVSLPRTQQEIPEVARAFQETLLDEVKAIPGVEAAATSLFIPLKPVTMNFRFRIQGRPSRTSDDFNANAEVVSDDYFRTIGTTLVAGRYFGVDNERVGDGGVVISETMAREYWPGESALGERLLFPYPDMSQKEYTVVGIIRDVTHDRLNPDTHRMVYLPQRQEPFGEFVLIIRTEDAEPLRYARAIRERIKIADSTAAVSEVAGMDEIDKQSLRAPALQTSLLSLFAALAVFLAASGLYGLLAHSVSRRTQEIGVRMALGASARAIARLVASKGLGLALTGLVIGILTALATTRFLSTVLYGISPTDSTTLAIASLLVLCVSTFATYLPARRATRIAPTRALSHE